MTARAHHPEPDQPHLVDVEQVTVLANPHRPEIRIVAHVDQDSCPTVHQLQPAGLPRTPAPPGGLYLLHLDPRYRHAGHYLGYADDIARRVHEHAASGARSSPLIRAALAAGCRMTLTRVWLGEGRTRERQLKRQGGLGWHCPVCRARGYRRAGRNA
jgi:predicted GIY-YIG superfamily endonuclease